MDIAKSEDVQSTSGKTIKRSKAKKKQFVLLKQKTKHSDDGILDIAKSEDVQSTSEKTIKRSNAKKKQFVLRKQKTKHSDACMGRA